MTKRQTTLAFLFFILAVFNVEPLSAREQTTALYLPAGSVEAAALIAPPPPVDSPGFREQMAVVLWMQRTRSPAQVAFVQEPLDLRRFAALLDADLLTVDGIALDRLVDAVIDEVRADYDAVKAQFDLPRPFVVNDAVEPVIEPRPVASYPSGHAIRAIVYARLLAEIFPERKDALIALARQIGYGRVTAGVHYPIDVTAGQTLGDAYADVIVQQPAFRQAVERLRQTR
ncbi:MAG: phosphatase PAP2 family protein [Rhodospirillales bacterium]|nr:phosphatase PAP2 family protein [Rhodospirillales bacterium]